MVSPISGTLPAGWQEQVISRQTDIYAGAAETLIPQEYILMDSVEITQAVCTGGKFHLGGVISSRLTFTLGTDCITFGDDRLKVLEHIVLENGSEYDIPQGVYFVDRTDSVITEDGDFFEGRYVAYDAFSRLDKPVTMNEAKGWHMMHGGPTGETLANLISFITNVINAGYSDWLYPSPASLQLISANDNNDRPYINVEREDSIYREYGYYLHKAARNGCTYRDVLSSIAVLMCGAFLIDRSYTDGLHYRLALFRAGASPVLTLTQGDRIRSRIDTKGGKPIVRDINYDTAVESYPISETAYTDVQLSLGDLAIVQTPGASARGQQTHYVLRSAMQTISKELCGWRTQSGGPVKVNDPITLTSAEIDWFGDPTLEAGDLIRCVTNSGNTDLYVLEHIYRLHRPSVIRSYAEANNSTYTSTTSPSYGETARAAGYNTALAEQIARISEQGQDFSGEISSLTARLTAAEEAIAAISTDVIYSTEERLIGKWTDDSDLYEKTVIIPSLGDGASRTVTAAHGIEYLGEVVESRGMLLASGVFRPLQGVPIGPDGASVLPGSGVSYSIDRKNITVVSGTDDLSGYRAYVTVRYTISVPTIYGWHVDPSISDPSQAVTYLADARGKAPAAMGATEFSYGDWENAFFMPRPCMLRYDGTVAYYLDPDDYTKKADGTASDVANASFEGNAMMEWPLIWYKFEAGAAEGECYFYCSDKQVDESYKCWCNINSENEITEHFYTAIYNGTGTSKLRSLSGVQLTSSSGCGNTTVSDEVSAATANNTTSDVEWYTEVYSDRALISALMILIGKTLDDKSTFGNGMLGGSIAAKEAYVTGSLDAAGLFYGDVTSQTAPVKIFGMENWYGCVWHRVAGLSAGTGSTYQYKLTYGTADGSTAVGYNASANGYISSSVTRPTNYSKQGLIVKMAAGVHGLLPSAIGADPNSTYYCSLLFSDSGNYAVYGGNAVSSIGGGSQCLGVGGSSGATWWGYAASLSCKPMNRR